MKKIVLFCMAVCIFFGSGSYASEKTEVTIMLSNYGVSMLEQARIFWKKNEIHQAMMYVLQAIWLDQKNEDAFQLRGDIYLFCYDYKQAMMDFNHALRLNPQSGPAHFGKGQAYMAEYRDKKNTYERSYLEALIDSAIQEFSQLIEIKYEGAHLARGIAYCERRDFEKGIIDFTKVLSEEGNEAKGYYYRGKAYGDAGDYNNAIADFTKAVELYPYFINAYEQRAKVYRKIKAIEESGSDRKRANQLKRDIGRKKLKEKDQPVFE